MARPILLGMNPSDDSYTDLDPRAGSGKRILEMVGDVTFGAFERRNVLRSKLWRTIEARTKRTRLRKDLAGRTVVAFGNEVWGALALPRAPWFGSTMTKEGSKYWRVPHPSGRNLMYNKAKNRDMLRELLYRIANE